MALPDSHARLPLRAAAITAALVAGLAFPQLAHADSLEDLVSVQTQATESRTALTEANDRIAAIDEQIAQNEQRLAQIEATMPELKDRASESVRTLYKMQQGSGSLVSLILSAEDFNDMLTTIQYLDVVQSHNCDSIEELMALATEYEQTSQDLNIQRQEAEEARAQAEEALSANEQAQTTLQAQIDAQAAAEEAERQAAVEQALAEAEAATTSSDNSSATFETESGNTATVQVPENSSPSTVDGTSERDAFIAEWTSRIDAYLAGSPLAGYGNVFAEAAYDYGVDPRFSPAISTVESSTGRYCFKSHNAWGWGSSSWSSWEEAIRDHVAGLASGYGGQLTYAAAQKYCPPTASDWYASVLACMEQI